MLLDAEKGKSRCSPEPNHPDGLVEFEKQPVSSSPTRKGARSKTWTQTFLYIIGWTANGESLSKTVSFTIAFTILATCLFLQLTWSVFISSPAWVWQSLLQWHWHRHQEWQPQWQWRLGQYNIPISKGIALASMNALFVFSRFCALYGAYRVKIRRDKRRDKRRSKRRDMSRGADEKAMYNTGRSYGADQDPTARANTPNPNDAEHALVKGFSTAKSLRHIDPIWLSHLGFKTCMLAFQLFALFSHLQKVEHARPGPVVRRSGFASLIGIVVWAGLTLLHFAGDDD